MSINNDNKPHKKGNHVHKETPMPKRKIPVDNASKPITNIIPAIRDVQRPGILQNHWTPSVFSRQRRIAGTGTIRFPALSTIYEVDEPIEDDDQTLRPTDDYDSSDADSVDTMVAVNMPEEADHCYINFENHVYQNVDFQRPPVWHVPVNVRVPPPPMKVWTRPLEPYNKRCAMAELSPPPPTPSVPVQQSFKVRIRRTVYIAACFCFFVFVALTIVLFLSLASAI